MPNTFVGLLLFVVVAAPGYIYLRIAESKSLRPVRSPLLQGAELVVIGVSASVASFFIVSALWLIPWIPSLDFGRLIQSGSAYVAREFHLMFSFAATLFIVSNGMAALFAWAVQKGKPAGYKPGQTVWADVLAKNPKEFRVVVAARLKDGRLIEGYLASFRTDAPPEGIEIALQAPIFVTLTNGEKKRLPHTDRTIILTKELADFAVQYERLDSQPGSPNPGPFSRVLTALRK